MLMMNCFFFSFAHFFDSNLVGLLGPVIAALEAQSVMGHKLAILDVERDTYGAWCWLLIVTKLNVLVICFFLMSSHLDLISLSFLYTTWEGI